jgi:hypothetical protein
LIKTPGGREFSQANSRRERIGLQRKRRAAIESTMRTSENSYNDDHLFAGDDAPAALAGRIMSSPETAEDFLFRARAFFYGGFCLWQIGRSDID